MRRWSLVAGEEVASVDFLFDVFEVFSDAVGDDDGAGVFEGIEVAGDRATVELGFVERGFVDEDVFAFGFDELNDVLNGGGAEVVGVGLHGEAVDAHDVGILF